MVLVEAVHLSGGEQHEHIAAVRWREPQTGKTGHTDRAAMVQWISTGGRAVVAGPGGEQVPIGVVREASAYLRTYANGEWAAHLLSLPRY